MSRRTAFTAFTFVAVLVLATSLAQAQLTDRVKMGTGYARGMVVEMDRHKVTIQAGAAKQELEVKDIDYVVYKDEPAGLTAIRNNLATGRFEDAKTELDSIEVDENMRQVVKQDVEFYKALAVAKLALAGQGDVRAAVTPMLNFYKANSGNYHYLEAAEVLGDLAMAAGIPDKAPVFYEQLGAAPWPEYQMKSAVLTGRALQTAGKDAEAIAQFEKALQGVADGDAANRMRLAATLGKAVSMAATGKVDEAIKMVTDVIAKASPEEGELHARAYNALGSCLEKAGKPKDALIAYLHVDVLYPAFTDEHAESLYHLSKLWPEIGKINEGKDAEGMLQQRYPNSAWAQKL